MSLADFFRSLPGAPAVPKASGPKGSCCHDGGSCERPPRPAERPSSPDASPEGAAPTQRLEVTVEKGYRPARLTARAGSPLRITFLRNETSGCSKEVVFPGLGIRRALPMGERVSIDLPPQAAGLVPFTCGMGMMKGGIEVR